MKPRKLTDAEERELFDLIEHRAQFTDKRLCERFGIGRRTLWDIVARARIRALAEECSTGNRAACAD